MKIVRHGYLIPETIAPVDSYCIRIEVPKDDRHVAAFFGALDELTRWYSWDRNTPNSGAELAKVWQAVVNETRDGFMEGCMDCDGIEACLITSDIIINIEGDIVTNQTDIDVNYTQITENTTNILYELVNPPDGNLYPPAPDVEIDPDPACGASYYVVSQFRVFIVDLEASAGTYANLLDALAGWFLSPLVFTVPSLISALVSIFAAAPSVLTDFDSEIIGMREHLYCNGFNKSEFNDYIRTLTGGDAIADYLECIGLSAFEQWFTIGSADLAQDCTAFCDWCLSHDWTIDAQGWFVGTWGRPAGILTGAGWVHEDLPSAVGQDARRTIMIERTFTASNITKIDILCDFTMGTFPVEAIAIILITELSTVRTDVYTKTNITAPTGTNIQVLWQDAGGQNMDLLRVFFRASRDSYPPPDTWSGNILLKTIEICGDAPQPPEL